MIRILTANILNINPYLQLFLNIGAIAVMLYTLKKFLGTPQNNLEQRITVLETKIADMERSLNTNWEETRRQKAVMDDIQLCILYLLDFEVTYCAHAPKVDGQDEIDTTDLDEARKIIRQRLKQ